MANTFTKVIIHLVFACKLHENYIPQPYRPSLFAYMSGIIKKLGCHAIIIGGTSSHVHILMDLSVTKSISSIVKELKVSSNKYIKY